jgi:chorismate mutase
MDDRDPLTEQLDRNRRDIEALDRRILHLVRERLEVASEIGDLKQRLGIPLRNFRVEASVLERFSEALQLPRPGRRAGAATWPCFLIGKAVEHQAEHRGHSLRRRRPCRWWWSAARAAWAAGSRACSWVRATG